MLALQCAALIAALSAGLASSAPGTWHHVVHEERGVHGKDWLRGDRIDGSAILPIRVGLTQTNLDGGHDLLMEVSHPNSAKYGQWWTADEVQAAFSPTKETVKAVREWLNSFGIHESRIVHSDNKGWLAFDASADEAEALLHTEFYEHKHKHSLKLRVGCDKYHIPEHLVRHIDYITPGIKLTQVVKRQVTALVDKTGQKQRRARPAVSKPKTNCPTNQNPFRNKFPWGYKPPSASQLPPDLQDCGRNITPPCYRALYQLPQPKGAVPGNSLGIYEQGDWFAKEDLDLYYKAFAPYVPQGTYPIPALIDGASYSKPLNDTEDVQGEANVDIAIAYSLIYPQTVTLYQVDDDIYAPQEVASTNLFNTFLDALDGSYCTYSAFGETGNDPSLDPIYPDPAPGGYKGKLQCGVYQPTKVISISYGEAEVDLPLSYTKRQCNEFMKLALQGHSVLVATGDYGVASFPGDGAENGCLGPSATIFNPQYPNNCPYLTAVGATMLYPDQTVRDRESVMHLDLPGAPNFTSAGGFSNYFPRPAYQKAAVDAYFARHNPPYPYYTEFSPQLNLNTTKGLYNRLGRAYPDISANGANMRSYVNGRLLHSYGTSLAAPLFASVLTLLNQERAAVQKGPIGFVNPVFYSHPEVLNDITNGTSAGCGTLGFAAVPGWDPATGLGTPNYPKMKALFLSLP